MEIQFKTAKNGLPGCSVNGMGLHSLYDPEKEAERFYQTEKPSYTPRCILAVASGLPYYGRKLKKEFPDAQLVSIQFTDAFGGDSLWNDEWSPADSRTLRQFLDRYINEETAPFLWFTVWPAGQRIWQQETEYCISLFSELLKTASSVHATRIYFGKRWLSNMLFNCVTVKNIVLPSPVSEPVIITAAGPGLEKTLPFLANIQPAPYIIAVSSSFTADCAAGLQPALCITSDGGYYAGEHLAPLSRADNYHTVIAAASESTLPQTAAARNPVILLAYGSPFERTLYRRLALPSYPAKRNGTVSGTAAEFALSITGRNVYAAGLDLLNENGKSHARPNERAIRQDSRSNRVSPPAGVAAATDAALETYAQWFDTRPESFTKRFFILNHSARTFKTVRTLSFADFSRDFSSDFSRNNCQKPRFSPQEIISVPERIEIIRQFLAETAATLHRIAGDPSALQADILLDSESVAGDFVRYTSWQELAQCKHSGNSRTHIADVCTSALAALEKLQRRIQKIAEHQPEAIHHEQHR